MNYYVNITTGELVETSETLSPFRFPSYNVQGWSNLNEFEYNVMTFVRGYGFCEGVRAEKEPVVNKDYDYDRSDDFSFCQHGERPENCDFCNS